MFVLATIQPIKRDIANATPHKTNIEPNQFKLREQTAIDCINNTPNSHTIKIKVKWTRWILSQHPDF